MDRKTNFGKAHEPWNTYELFQTNYLRKRGGSKSYGTRDKRSDRGLVTVETGKGHTETVGRR